MILQRIFKIQTFVNLDGSYLLLLQRAKLWKNQLDKGV